MKKQIFKLIKEHGYEPSYSGTTGTLYVVPSVSINERISFEELREVINDFVEKHAQSEDDIFFDNIVYQPN